MPATGRHPPRPGEGSRSVLGPHSVVEQPVGAVVLDESVGAELRVPPRKIAIRLCQPLPSATTLLPVAGATEGVEVRYPPVRLQPLYGGPRRGAVAIDHLAQGRPCRLGDSGLDQAGDAIDEDRAQSRASMSARRPRWDSAWRKALSPLR